MSLMQRFAAELSTGLFGNPHSESASSQLSTARIEDVRLRLLQHFGADPGHFDLVFVANATAGIKLVVEAFRAMPRSFHYAYHQACHTSMVGAREEALDSCCLDDAAVEEWARGRDPFMGSHTVPSAKLFAYSAQSHMDGRRYPTTWSERIRQGTLGQSCPIYFLLDAASLAATSRLHLGDPELAPDFTVLSLYKIYGLPDLGALIARRQAEPVFNHKKFFGGGTVDMVVCGHEKWHAPKSMFLHERLEDGTLPFHNILALGIALDIHKKLYGSMLAVASHTAFLYRRLRDGLASLTHANGEPVCVAYLPKGLPGQSDQGCGPLVSFNIRNSSGAWISLVEFDKLANLKKIHVRTGGLCSPGGISAVLGLEPWEMKRNFSAGFRCGAENDIVAGKPTGVIRASLGAMSTISDVDAFIDFIREFYCDTNAPITSQPAPGIPDPMPSALVVQSITVYPIKSCGGFEIPRGNRWEVRAEGLVWDREWCLIHRGTGQALSQKRHPRMALLRPSLDFKAGVLRVNFQGPTIPGLGCEISVPLSGNPNLFQPNPAYQPARSRVCGDDISAQTYTSQSINEFFSAALGVSCVLARFPPGGDGHGMRYAKASTAWNAAWNTIPDPNNVSHKIPGSFPALPSPPDSDSEQSRSRILLSNESPILMINSASVASLNAEICAKGSRPVSASAFRANVVLGTDPSGGGGQNPAYAEDGWTRLRIGQQAFDLMGRCRRCQMVCVDQLTGEKSEEPYITLAKTRRFTGKVYFGAHMRRNPDTGLATTKEAQYPTIQVGDVVQIES
jgi:molybdenum cofactor sulfurtransferase